MYSWSFRNTRTYRNNVPFIRYVFCMFKYSTTSFLLLNAECLMVWRRLCTTYSPIVPIVVQKQKHFFKIFSKKCLQSNFKNCIPQFSCMYYNVCSKFFDNTTRNYSYENDKYTATHSHENFPDLFLKNSTVFTLFLNPLSAGNTYISMHLFKSF